MTDKTALNSQETMTRPKIILQKQAGKSEK